MTNRLVACYVDADPRFCYQAWCLVNSLLDLGGVRREEIVVAHAPETDPVLLEEIRGRGLRTKAVPRFGDKKYCNKVGMLAALVEEFGPRTYLLLDSDIVIADKIDCLFQGECVKGKPVDLARPPLGVLEELLCKAKFSKRPRRIWCTNEWARTYDGNYNGGVYLIPSKYAKELSRLWLKWSRWLLSNSEPLQRVGLAHHVDQIAFCFAVLEGEFPLHRLSSDWNFPLHLEKKKRRRWFRAFGAARGVKIIHYHKEMTNVGLLPLWGGSGVALRRKIESVNAVIGSHYNGRLFWSYRYSLHPELGSGVGSRGENLTYKRLLLKRLGVEKARSVLDVGCGDLKLVEGFRFRQYTGVDISPTAIENARKKHPEWNFVMGAAPPGLGRFDVVLCFEVAIHQETEQDYRRLIDFVVSSTDRLLVMSGYVERPALNHMVFYYESLVDSLQKTGEFRSVRIIGAHTSVKIVVAER